MWKTIVGIEIHAEMLTESKMFSPCAVVDSVAAAPNSAVDELSLGLPGTLPVVNEQAMIYGVMVGLALNCEIPPFSQFVRKSYFYPDLPKGYQISQYKHPLAVGGYVDITLEDGRTKTIRVRRAHMEEDTGKLTHIVSGALVDYNRAGVPLLEIVSEPDMDSAYQAEAYARKIRSILRYLGVNHGDMSKGILRFEANVSVMHADDHELRQRTEIKNLNSIRSLSRAIDAEAKRQIQMYERGDTVKSATLGWHEVDQRVVVQRYKERPDEYRYFPDPDLPIVVYTEEQVTAIRSHLPELPDAKKQRFMTRLGLSDYDAGVLVAEKAVADYYEQVIQTGVVPKLAANWLITNLFSLMKTHSLDSEAIFSIPITPEDFAKLIALYDNHTLNKSSTNKVLGLMWDTGSAPDILVEEHGLAQISDEAVIVAQVEMILDDNDKLVQEYLDGKEKLFGALMGQCVKALQGKGDPQVIRRVLQDILSKRRTS